MVRYFLFVAAILGSAATAIAAIAPDAAPRKNITVIEKNQFWQVVDDFTVADCDNEDCAEDLAD